MTKRQASSRDVRTKKKRRLVREQLTQEAESLIRSLIPQSCKDTEANLRKQARGVHMRTQYRPFIVAAILRNLMIGVSRGAAAYRAGVTAQQLYNWTALHPDLAESLARAEAHVEHHAVSIMVNAFKQRPQLITQFLERRFPKSWAQQSRTEHTGVVLHGVGSAEWLQNVALARAALDRRALKPEAPSGGLIADSPANTGDSPRQRDDFGMVAAAPVPVQAEVEPVEPPPPPPPSPREGVEGGEGVG